MNTRTRAPKTALSFQSTAFEVVDHDGEPWLRGAQIALALGYKTAETAIKDLYNRNADELLRGRIEARGLPAPPPPAHSADDARRSG